MEISAMAAYILNFLRIAKSCKSRFGQGTGSIPWPPQGEHRPILFIASQLPLMAPYFFTASMP
jgi:hypothetical protein